MNSKARWSFLVSFILVLAMLAPSFVTASAGDVYIHATASSNVRSSPSLSGKLLGTVSEGTKLSYAYDNTTDSRGVLWYEIYYDGSTGWVSSRYCEMVDASDDPKDYYPDSSYVRATASVNVRSSPKLSGKELGTLSEGTTATYLDSTSTDSRGVDWYKISYDGGSAWVSSTYTVLVKSKSITSYVLAEGNLNVRSSPGLSGKKLGTMSEGDTATYLDSKSTDDRGMVWYKISYKGGSGWVSSKYSKLYK